jgi:hypothetical protein
MTEDLHIDVVVGDGEYDDDDGDTVIAVMPDDFYVEVEGKRSVMFQPLARALREIGESSAEGLGRRLHHGEFWITTNPDTVREKGLMHTDCEECHVGVIRALAGLAAHPDRELIVGRLFWQP